MFRMWARMYANGRCIRDTVIADPGKKTRTAKVFAAVDGICREFDLAKPLWLDKNIKEFKKMSKTSFNQDSFIETISFDTLKIEIIEEDEP